MTEAKTRMPTYFIPHGAGPCFFMEWTRGASDMWDGMAAWLRSLGSSGPARPKALLVISGHWEVEAFTVTGGARPPLIYDYYGFPEHTYQLAYPAPGDPGLAARVAALLRARGLAARVDPERGFDHGVFIPLKLMAPEAELPVVQLSLHTGLDPALHLEAGRALAPLRDEGVLIVGSGMSYHNMRGFAGSPRALGESEAFDAWLTGAVGAASAAERDAALARWERAPSARASHPREEHLLPLMVAAGPAPDAPGARLFTDLVMGVRISGYGFGAAVS